METSFSIIKLSIHYRLYFVQWMPELRRFSPTIPVVLVGTKLGEVDTTPSNVHILVPV